jgi:ribosome biogenesis GTPase
MARRSSPGRKKRVELRPNRQPQRRTDEWTRLYYDDQDRLADVHLSESVRAKGELSRKRTLIVDESDAPAVDESLWRPGLVTAVHGLVNRVEDHQGRTWDCTVRRMLRTLLIEQRAPVTCGDRVWFSDHSRLHDGAPVGVIERVDPRSTVLSRRDFRGRQHAIVVNADQLLIVASVARPRLKPHLIDRYLVAAGKGNLRPVICFHKWDLAGEYALGPGPEEDEPEEQARDRTLDSLVDEFQQLGYRCLRTSVVSAAGLEELKAELTGHTSVLAGQSGVGKSSLINALQPGLNLAVQEVSEENEKGRHTTSHARLLRLDFGGYVVDTPGIRQFDLWAVEPGELEAYFIEFAPLVAGCRFNDCHHRDEEGCAIRAAVQSGQISRRRYLSYLKTLEELAQERREQYR